MLKYAGFIYETTNDITGKKYIGGRLGDAASPYLGSGVDLYKDLKKFGTERFTRRILEYVSDEKLIGETEVKWLLSVDAKNNPNYYNKSNSSSSCIRRAKQKKRKICPYCKLRPVAINYYRDEIIYYKNKCSQCYRKKRKPAPPAWVRTGYKKKDRCEKCNRPIRYAEAGVVYHLDGSISNTDWVNLRTICLVCEIDIKHNDTLPWKPSKISPDF